jgi:ParB/RepB/Spo0J family partition protein
MIVNVPLERIRDNPFQPRQTYPGIEDLAGKILALKSELPGTLGLIHPPNARLVNGEGQPVAFLGGFSTLGDEYAVQLAEGHRRLRAFRLLAEQDPKYLQMPVNVVDMDDRTMDDIAWDENLARKDLSPIEEARALQRSLERFGLTQAELADRRRLARSTVTNKLRLLQLPDAMLDAIHEGKLTERHGLAFLPVLDIPTADLPPLKSNVNFGVTWEAPTPDTLRKRLVEVGDLTADQVRQVVERIKRETETAKKRKWEAKPDTAGRPSAPVIPGPAKTAPVMRPAGPASVPSPEPQRLEMPPRSTFSGRLPTTMPASPDVVVTIRVHHEGTFTLSIGEDGQFPQFFKGDYPGDLAPTLQHACDLFLPPAQSRVCGTQDEGEQILMEMEVPTDE